jgi:dihydropyrimidine dehydrogenase (NAD+) subunit PreT
MNKPAVTRLEAQRAESVFSDYKAPYDAGHAVAEANRCLYCDEPPCQKACPTAIDIPQFIRKIATGNLKGSARTIFDSNILGMSCARVCPVEVLCVGDCVYNHMDQPPIQIGKLQRYATDIALAEGWQFWQAGADTGKSVGLVGAGPASIAAAHQLRRAGHAVTIYDKRDVVGGLNTWGVAPYKMKAESSLEEIEWVLKIGGIDIQLGVGVGPGEGALPWAELEARHDAVFLGFGLGEDSGLDALGQDLEGVHGAVDFIECMKTGAVDLSWVKRAAVVGGGNTAIDAVRELKGLGVAEVVLVYRGNEAGMSGYAHEWKAAKVDGVTSSFGSQPLAFLGAGRVQSIHCARFDSNKQPTGDTFTIATDLVLLAIGQGKLGSLLAGVEGVGLNRGKVVVDADGATGRAGWYAAGDCANGGKEVVNAVAEGKRAATAIDVFLRSAQQEG